MADNTDDARGPERICDWCDETSPQRKARCPVKGCDTRADLAAPSHTVKVKSLVWEAGDGKARSEDCFIAKDGFGKFYTVIEAQWIHSSMDAYLTEASDELAKAAAQANYETRILSTLEPAAPSPDVLALVEALRGMEEGWRQCGCNDVGCRGRHEERDMVLDHIADLLADYDAARITDTGGKTDD